MKAKRGFGLLAVVFVILVFSVLAIGFVSFILSESRLSVYEYRYARAFYIAEAGKNFALKHLSAYSDWSANMGMPLIRNFGGGIFTVSTNEVSANQVKLTSVGLVTIEGKTYESKVRFTVSLSPGSSLTHQFGYAMYIGPPSGGATLRIEGDAGIYGDFYYNGPIRLGGSAHQSGGIIYSTSLDVYGSATYASWEAASPVDMPIWDNGPYNTILAATDQSAASSLNLGWGQTLNLGGLTHYYRSIEINWGATVNGPGTLVATAKPSGSGDITINYGQGIGQGVRFVAERDFIYQGGSNLVNSIEAYVERDLYVKNSLTVPSGSVLYSKGTGDHAIDITGTANANLLAPYGRVYMSSGAIRGLIYGDRIRTANSGEIRGAIVCHTPSSIQGFINIYYDPTYLPASLLGLAGTGEVTGEAEISVTDWQEVY